MIRTRNLTHFGLPLLAASVFALSFATPSASALVAIGDQAGLFFNGSASARWDDNIFLDSSNEESDLIFILSPGLELNVGTRGNSNVNLYYREDFYLYDDNSHLDSNQSNVFLESYWNQARLDLRFDASYQQLIQATPDFVLIPGQLIERDYYRANLRGEYDISDRTSVASGVNWSRIDFQTRPFVDRDSLAVPVNFYYEMTPQVDLSLGYRFRHTDTGTFGGGMFGPETSVSNYTDHYFNVGARGEVAPKLIGEARAGFQNRDIKDGGSESGVSFGVDFSHFTTPNSTLMAGIYRDFEVAGEGDSITATGGNLGLRHTFSHLIAGNAGVNYYERNYDRSSRKDETLDLNVGVTYSPITYVDLSAGYIYRTNSSTSDAFEFDNNIFTVSAALRY